MTTALLVLFATGAAWFIRRDTARREGLSAALWIPTLWVGILASRPLSTWLGYGGGEDTLEGSPLDRLFFLVLIIASTITLLRRGAAAGDFLARNGALLLFYAYLLVSVLWADAPMVSAKRWLKDFGNILVALVVLTELNPIEAFRAVFVRCAYVLIPLSVIFIRYLPEWGRRYSPHSGQMEATGVTFQKNSLGVMVLVCGLVLLWDWLERTRSETTRLSALERFMPPGVLALGAWLLHISDSKTSILCFALGAFILLASRLPLLRQRINSMGVYLVVLGAGFFVADRMFGLSTWLVTSLGRDMTFTGRTEVWRELLALKTDPLFGTGFCSFWSNPHYLARLPDWVSSSAHNGYLEMYIDGGWLGAGLLGFLLLVLMRRMQRLLTAGGRDALAFFAVLVVAIIANFSESHFGRMSPLWFLFILAALAATPAAEFRRTAPAAAPQPA